MKVLKTLSIYFLIWMAGAFTIPAILMMDNNYGYLNLLWMGFVVWGGFLIFPVGFCHVARSQGYRDEWEEDDVMQQVFGVRPNGTNIEDRPSDKPPTYV